MKKEKKNMLRLILELIIRYQLKSSNHLLILYFQKIVTLAFLFHITTFLIAQNGVGYKFGGSKNDRITDFKFTRDNGLILTGYTESSDKDFVSSKGDIDCFLIKLNSSFQKEWSFTYGGSKMDQAFSVEVVDDGYIVGGLSTSSDGDIFSHSQGINNDAILIKLDFKGRILWQKSYGGTGDDRCYSIRSLSGGNIIIAGSSSSLDGIIEKNKGSHDCFIVKTNSEGKTIWAKNIGGNRFDIANSVIETKDGGYIIAGNSNSSDGDVQSKNENTDIFIVKLNENGKILWTKCFGGDNVDEANVIISSKDGGFCICGYTFSSVFNGETNNGEADGFIVKFTSSGDIEWTRLIGTMKNDILINVDNTLDTGFIATGFFEVNDQDYIKYKRRYSCQFLKLNKEGKIEIDSTFADEGFAIGKVCKQNIFGNIIIAEDVLSTFKDMLPPKSTYYDIKIKKIQ